MTAATMLRPASRGIRLTPAQLPSLVGWYEADALALSDTNPVATWADASGGGRDLTQATAGKRPLYRTAILNGLPVVRFDGTDDWLATGATAYSVSAARTVTAVAKQTGAAEKVAWGGGADVQMYASTTWRWYANQAGGSLILGGTPTGWSVVTVVIASATSAAGYVDGTASATFDPHNDAAAFQQLTAGDWSPAATDYFGGDIAALVVNDAVLTPTQILGLHRHLSTKYAVPVA